MEEQSALNEEVWASHTALEARVAKTEERLVETGQQLIQDSGHIFVAAALEKRLGTLLPILLHSNSQRDMPSSSIYVMAVWMPPLCRMPPPCTERHCCH